MALVIAAAMVMGMMSVAALAADGDQMVNPTQDSVITVSGLATGDTVNFYQILEWKGSEGTYGGWSFVDGISYSDFTDQNFADDKAAIQSIIGDPAGNPAVQMQLKSVIAGLIADKKSALTAKAGSAVSGGKSTLAIGGESGNTLGMYMALITPADQDTVYNPVFVSADYNTSNTSDTWAVTSASSYSDNAAAKKSTVTIDKKAEQKDGSKSYDQTWTSTRPGEIVDYTVTTTIPGYGEVYQSPTFDVKDKLTDLKLASVPTVEVEGFTLASSDYTVSGGVGDTNYTVHFTPAFLKTVKVPSKVTITYKAEVTSSAPMNVNLEKNEVWVEYSHDPTAENDFNVKKDDTNHYTYTIDADILGNWGDETRTSGSEIIKVGVDASGNPINETKVTSVVSTSNSQTGPLEGAQFKLYTDAGCAAANEYKKADGSTYELASDGSGRIKIEGLDAGTYWLKETKAPSGFIADQRAIKIDIVPTFTTKSYTEYWNATDGWHDTKKNGDKEASYDVQVLQSYKVLVNDVEASQYTFTNEGPKKINISSTGVKEVPQSIVNTKGVELPSTGGMGTTLFYIIGAVLVLGAGILLVTRRRMNAN